jgi:hypothetical protein
VQIEKLKAGAKTNIRFNRIYGVQLSGMYSTNHAKIFRTSKVEKKEI